MLHVTVFCYIDLCINLCWSIKPVKRVCGPLSKKKNNKQKKTPLRPLCWEPLPVIMGQTNEKELTFLMTEKKNQGCETKKN